MRTMNYEAKKAKKIRKWVSTAKKGRILDKFAWWPVKMNNDSWVWLERYVQGNRFIVGEVKQTHKNHAPTGKFIVADTMNTINGLNRWHSRKDIPAASRYTKRAIDPRVYNTEELAELNVDEFYAGTGDELT